MHPLVIPAPVSHGPWTSIPITQRLQPCTERGTLPSFRTMLAVLTSLRSTYHAASRKLLCSCGRMTLQHLRNRLSHAILLLEATKQPQRHTLGLPCYRLCRPPSRHPLLTAIPLHSLQHFTLTLVHLPLCTLLHQSGLPPLQARYRTRLTKLLSNGKRCVPAQGLSNLTKGLPKAVLSRTTNQCVLQAETCLRIPLLFFVQIAVHIEMAGLIGVSS
jgi:hypothetical protein